MSGSIASSRNPFLPDLCAMQSVFFLVLGAELLAFALVIASAPLAYFSWVKLGQISMLVQWITLSNAAVLCRLRFWLGGLSPSSAGTFSYLLVLAITLLFSWGGGVLMYREVALLESLRAALLAAIIAGVVLRYMYLQQQLANEQQAQAQAQIAALQARIRPHFLFNSMNALASLVSIDPERAEQLVLDLSDLFRASMAEAALVPVSQEIQLGQQYLAVEQVRLDSRLSVSWSTQGELERAVMPSLMLQPLLENAVYHGIEPLSQGGVIEVVVEVTETTAGDAFDVVITLHNDKPSGGSSETRGSGIAQQNIRQRLVAHFGEQASFAVEDHDNHYAVKIAYRCGREE
ncbi:sensor histidine kinase [Marinibactrum halimedae]|uniref:Alginate O-acetyltransferase n=1 Tax=Marinibactrum halimedae TaxID=1444977 RepID=A0AA37T531_9GAMM|nr:histidine kinase [Marinibactrum halimedae]MCD9458298.1 histidine kinase [Marinibactrum halimedae]GLS27075.1 alginate O-acetyltransferase [Marinibactrum halimedae]